MQEIKRPRGIRYRLKRGPKIVLGILILGIAGFIFYQSQQPKISFNEVNIVEYGATHEEALASIINTDSSRYDSIEAVSLDTTVISTEAQPTYEGVLEATYKGNTKTVNFKFSVEDTQVPIIKASETSFAYSDSNVFALYNALDEMSAYDIVDGDIELYYSFDEMKDTKFLTTDEVKSAISQLQYNRTYPFTAYATDLNGNTTTLALDVTVNDGGMTTVSGLTDSQSATMLNTVTAQYATVFDVENDSILYEMGYENKIYPASMTKMMTVYAALMILDEGITPTWNNKETVTLDTVYTVPTTIDWIHTSDASNAGIWGNDVVSIRDLLYGVMLPSGADAAMALSEALTGSSDGLVVKMNELATQLSMTRTHFANTTGLHDNNHYTSMKDLITLLKTAWQNEAYRIIMSSTVYVTDQAYVSGRRDVFESYSLTILDMMGDNDVVASKSGYTDESGRSLASVVVKGERVYFVIVNHSNEDGIGLSAVTDTMALIRQYIDN